MNELHEAIQASHVKAESNDWHFSSCCHNVLVYFPQPWDTDELQ